MNRRNALAAAGIVGCLAGLLGLFVPAFTGSGLDWGSLGWAVAWCGFPIAGALIVARRPQNHVGLAMLGTGFAVGIGTASDSLVPADYSPAAHSVLAAVALNINNWIFPAAYVLLVMVVLLFPAGRLSRRLRAGAWLLTADTAVLTVALATRPEIHLPRGGRVVANPLHVGAGAQLASVVSPTTTILSLSALATVAWSAIRYWRSRGIERLQRKWVALTVLTGAAVFVLAALVNPITRVGWWLSLTALTIAVSGTAAAILAAVFRYHLYDIDRVVSRTMSYVVLTGLLLGVYVGLVTLSTHAVPVGSSVGVAAATLAAAGLFNPLRRRVQQLVDRRFNRTRYDAERVVESFAAHVRGSVALESLHDQLVAAVHQTVEPAHSSLWLVR